MKTAIAALTLLSLAGTALAAPRETQTLAGPYAVYGTETEDPSPLNSTVSVAFAADYNVVGVRIAMELTAVEPFTWLIDMTVRCIPPVGEPFDVLMSPLEGEYVAYANLTSTNPIPDGVTNAGTWQFLLWDTFLDSETGGADATVSNLRISLESDEPPAPSHDFGTLNGTDQTHSMTDYAGGEVRWLTVTLPQNADDASAFWLDINTKGSATAEAFNVNANDTELGLYRSDGTGVAVNDDIAFPAEVESALTFGAATPREHGASVFVYDGRGPDLVAGTYYIATGTFNLDFYNNTFNVDTASDSAGGTIVVNVFSNFSGGPAACSAADLGVQGGQAGQDDRLDNNDFIVFIDYFFTLNPLADFGVQGGEPGQDGAFDNNDFIAFIDAFFNDQAACTG